MIDILYEILYAALLFFIGLDLGGIFVVLLFAAVALGMYIGKNWHVQQGL